MTNRLYAPNGLRKLSQIRRCLKLIDLTPALAVGQVTYGIQYQK